MRGLDLTGFPSSAWSVLHAAGIREGGWGPLLWAVYQRKHIRFRVQSLGITKKKKKHSAALEGSSILLETNLCLCSCCCHCSDNQEALTGYVMEPGHAGQPAENQKTLLQKEQLFPLQLRICRHVLSLQQDSDSYEVLPKLMSSGQRPARFSDLSDVLPISTSPRDPVRWCVPRPKAVGMLALQQALSSQAAPAQPAPKSSFSPQPG